ncbi:hypothetical protein CW751_06840 [Brumimicrobium salinarum]|uniref:Immunoglobulin domain-containing protein n=1 Tax=Brumimicrobium salinarum TaxID=2058658 RepID=A0A2I0R3A4_9FLAO|nr:gliding motility-associated C-terminal domain-containing protein [Brumimicrobium salinarum]PKR80880.1 hypothetical protein CW751_06840 [Brumimicrobium salinarum]
MKSLNGLLFTLTVLIFIANNAFSQSDNCSFAPNLPVTSSCASPTMGSSAGASQNLPGCVGNADDDVWYEFVATSTSHRIEVGASSGYDPVLQVFKNSCSSLNNLGCIDDYGTGSDEVFNYTNYIVGQTYKIRIYHYGVGSGTGDFSICLTNPLNAPSNDDCINATPLSVNSSCVYQSFDNIGATASIPGCAGNADEDVWFSFVATNSVQEISVNPSSTMDAVVQLFTGTCGSLTSLYCEDLSFSGGIETVNAIGLIPGQVYYFRVYDYYTGRTGTFDVCVKGAPTPAPINDEPCSAIKIPTVTSECTYSTFTNVGATASPHPRPTDCDGNGTSGGYSINSKDVWFEITVPPSGQLSITSQPNMGAGSISDGVMALYGGTCSNLAGIYCSDDFSYPGSANDNLPYIERSGLTPGSTVYLRYYGYGVSEGTFGFCVSTTTNDDCANALEICDINGYKGSTVPAYTADRPGNMRGNAEMNNPPTYTWTPGTNQGGVFGKGGSWGNGSPLTDVQINNNSWIKFTASATTATLNVSIYDCFIGNYPSGGIQMQIFSSNNCSNFIPVSNFEENSTGFVITANGLTVGDQYYLMVDGYAGDICSYTISANTGVSFPNIDPVPPLCAGGSTTLTAPPGATSYNWLHNGSTSRSVTVNPSVTTTYTCEVTGLCNYRQTLTRQVVVKPNPNVTFSTGASPSICAGESITINASGGSSYLWSNGQTGSSISVSPSSNTTYSVTATLDGCQSTEQVNVNVNSLPQLSVSPTANDASCGMADGSLTGTVVNGSAPFSYEWTSGGSIIGTTRNINNVSAGLYSLNVTDGNGCSNDFGPFGITNPGAPAAPAITVSNNSACEDENVSFSIVSPDPSATYEWNGPNGFTSNNTSFSVPVNSITDGNYCVVSTVANCTGASACETIALLPPPELNLSSSVEDSVACVNSDVTLSASGANTYTWTGPGAYTANGNAVSIPNVNATNQGWYTVEATDGSGCKATDSLYVAVADLPTANANASGSSDNSFCEGAIVEVNGTGGVAYHWNGPNGFSSTQQNDVILDFNANNEGIYFLTVTDSNGCVDQDTTRLSLAFLDNFGVLTADTSVCPGDDFALTASGADNYLWYGPDGFEAQGNPVEVLDVSFDQAGIYYVEGFNEEGCSDADSMELKVKISRDCLFIPGFTSPNDDGLNDGWVITGIEAFPDAEVFIYNRWGNLAFYASPYENDWFGQVNKGVKIGGKDGKVPAGTYFYVIQLNDGIDEPIKGYLELQY